MKGPILLLSWLLLMVPVAVRAQFDYTVINQTITIDGYTGTNPVVIIPSAINGLPVTSIGPLAFFESFIQSVTIPDSVTSIMGICAWGMGAFAGCPNLSTVTI